MKREKETSVFCQVCKKLLSKVGKDYTPTGYEFCVSCYLTKYPESSEALKDAQKELKKLFIR